MMTRWRTAALLMAAVLTVGAACNAQNDPADPDPTTTTAPNADINGDHAAPPGAGFEIPDTPAGDALAWVLDSTGTEPDDTDVEARFDEAFLAEVSPSRLRQVFMMLGPVTSRVELRHASEHTLSALVELDGELFEVQLIVEEIEPHRMSGLLFTPIRPAPEVPSSIDQAAVAWAGLAPDATMLVAEVVNGECRPVSAEQPDLAGPIASTFKLYVLAAVAAAVEEGTITWDDPVPIRDEWKSHPSGTFQDLPAGTERTVEEHARAMIAQSDNTATDHLIHLVGRDAVESAFVELDHSQPELNRPLLTTREMFLIKMGGVDDELDAYLDGSEDERRALLASWTDRQLPGLEHFSPTPTLVHEAEWFASPADLCRAMVVIEELSRWPGLEPIDTILQAPSGLLEPRDQVVWFKGGSEPGVLNATLMITDGETRIFVSGTLVDPAAVQVDELGAIRWLAAVGTLAFE